MLRRYLCAGFVPLALAGAVFGADYSGRFKSVDVDRKTMTLTVDERDRVFQVAPDTVVIDDVNGKSVIDLANFHMQPKKYLMVCTEGKGHDEIVTTIRVGK
jgi:hypothetical protein